MKPLSNRLKPLLLIGIFCGLLWNCEKDDPVATTSSADYAGNWELSSSSAKLDTTFEVEILTNGRFERLLEYNGVQGTLKGQVSRAGNMTGSIQVFIILNGSLNGKLQTDGSGSGNYYLASGDTIPWVANRL